LRNAALSQIARNFNQLPSTLAIVFSGRKRPRAHHRRAIRKWGAGMILRAIFGIGLVAFLMPHEPDLGYGRPGARSSEAIGGMNQSTHKACPQQQAGCSGWFGVLQSIGMRSIDEVRADIEAHRSHRRI
jgi:hypothetical protein